MAHKLVRRCLSNVQHTRTRIINVLRIYRKWNRGRSQNGSSRYKEEEEKKK